MKARQTALIALAAVVTLTSVAAAGPDTAKQRIAITATVLPSGAAVLMPQQDGGFVRDTGSLMGDWSSVPVSSAMRDGQKVDTHTGTWTFAGKRGDVIFRERNEWVDVGNGYGVAVGTWKVLRGTGEYAGITGGGRSGHAGLGRRWFARYEGFVTLP